MSNQLATTDAAVETAVPAAPATVPAQPAATVPAAVPAKETQPEFIVLEKKDIHKVVFLESGIPYSKGKRQEKGQTFSRFRYNDLAFAVPDSMPFAAEFQSGQVKQITLKLTNREIDSVDDKGIETKELVPAVDYISHINSAQWASIRDEEREEAQHDFIVSKFRKLKSEPVSADLMTALLAAAPSATA